jgi:hypothetical protein
MPTDALPKVQTETADDSRYGRSRTASRTAPVGAVGALADTDDPVGALPCWQHVRELCSVPSAGQNRDRAQVAVQQRT